MKNVNSVNKNIIEFDEFYYHISKKMEIGRDSLHDISNNSTYLEFLQRYHLEFAEQTQLQKYQLYKKEALLRKVSFEWNENGLKSRRVADLRGWMPWLPS